MLRPAVPSGAGDPFADGRLRPQPVRAGGPPWAAGLRPLPGALLVVPHGVPTHLLVWFSGAQGRAVDALPLVAPIVAERRLLALLVDSRRGTWDLVHGRFGPDVAALSGLLSEVLGRYDVRVALAGFSDGASYALSLGVTNGDVVEQVLAFSPGWCRPGAPVGRPGIRVAHGTRDGVLPAEAGREVAADLDASGYDVELVEFDGGHVVTPGLVADALHSWLG